MYKLRMVRPSSIPQAMALLTTTAQQPYPPPEKPITIEGLSEFWFLIMALVSIVAFLVRLEFGVSSGKDRLSKIEDESLPTIHREIELVESNIESRITEAKAVFSKELNNALDNHKIFLQSRFDLLLEKLSTRDAAIADLKEQANRQGREIREMHGYCQHVEKIISKD